MTQGGLEGESSSGVLAQVEFPERLLKLDLHGRFQQIDIVRGADTMLTISGGSRTSMGV